MGSGLRPDPTLPRFLAAFVISSAVHTAAFFTLPGGGAASRSGRFPANAEHYLVVELKKAPAPVPAQKIAARPPAKMPGRTPVRPAPAAAEPIRPRPGPVSAPVSSEALLRDPVRSGIFSQYFQTVKMRIQAVAERHKTFLVRERGKVDIRFVLDRDGLIAELAARPDEEAAGNPLLVSRALQIIRESEPFAVFPGEIKARSVSFNITLVFDG